MASLVPESQTTADPATCLPSDIKLLPSVISSGSFKGWSVRSGQGLVEKESISSQGWSGRESSEEGSGAAGCRTLEVETITSGLSNGRAWYWSIGCQTTKYGFCSVIGEPHDGW